MGKGYVYKCPKCNRESYLLLGNGMRSFCKEQLFDFESDDNIIIRSKNDGVINLSELLDFIKLDYVVVNKNFGNDYYFCDKCKSFDVRFYYYLRAKEVIYKPNYLCKRCGEILSHFQNKNICYNYYCRKCNIPMIDTGNIINWD